MKWFLLFFLFISINLGAQIVPFSYIKSNLNSVNSSAPILNNLPSPAVAFSLRLLNSSYSGSAINVRRSSDNTTMDIGFLQNGFLDLSTLRTFVGSGNGFVTIWYDQSGNANNAVQFTTSNQPQIVLNGNVILKNSLPTINFLASSYTYLSMNSYPMASSSSASIILVYADNTSNTWGRLFDFGTGTSANFFGALLLNPEIRMRITLNSGPYEQGQITSGSITTNDIVWSFNHNGTSMGINKNGATYGTPATSVTILPSALSGAYQNYIGKSQYNDPYLNGYYQEFIVFPASLTSSQETTLVNNQKTTYSITGN